MPEQKKLIQFKNIVKSFEDGQVVLKGVSLDIYENEFVTLLGPSGCGKTTLLRILGGFLQPTEGKVLFDGEDIVNVPPYKREINTVFQKYALFPHMNVYDNIAFGLTIKKEPKDVIAQKVMRMLRLVSLEDYADRNVTELSGGQQQRIAIARALVNEPVEPNSIFCIGVSPSFDNKVSITKERRLEKPSFCRGLSHNSVLS